MPRCIRGNYGRCSETYAQNTQLLYCTCTSTAELINYAEAALCPCATRAPVTHEKYKCGAVWFSLRIYTGPSAQPHECLFNYANTLRPKCNRIARGKCGKNVTINTLVHWSVAESCAGACGTFPAHAHAHYFTLCVENRRQSVDRQFCGFKVRPRRVWRDNVSRTACRKLGIVASHSVAVGRPTSRLP